MPKAIKTGLNHIYSILYNTPLPFPATVSLETNAPLSLLCILLLFHLYL